MRPSLHAAARTAALLACGVLAATPAGAQVQVSLRPVGAPEAVFVADLMPGSAGVRPDLVGITLVRTDASPPAAQRSGAVAGGGTGPTISLELTVSRESPSPAQVFEGTTDPFVLEAPVRHITSTELLSRGRDVSITQSTVNRDALDGPAGRSGRLMAGTYAFAVAVRDAQGTVIDHDELRITVAAASRVELLYPGAPADAAPPEVPGPTPRFLWSGQGEDPGATYRIRVVKVDASGSPVEALQSGYPAWDAAVQGTSAFYPASAAALRLEPGASYAWQVTRELRTSGGTELVESPIFWFRVGGAGVPGATRGGLDLRWAALLRSLGIAGLDGYTPTGATLADGRPFPLDRLEDLLAAIQAGEVALLSVRVR